MISPILQLAYTTDIPTIRKAYKKLLLTYHPDKFANDPQAQEMASYVTQKLTLSYKTIIEHLEKITQQ